MALFTSGSAKGEDKDMANEKDDQPVELKSYKARSPQGMETNLKLSDEDAQSYANLGWEVEGKKAEEGSIGAQQAEASEAKAKHAQNKARQPSNKAAGSGKSVGGGENK